MMQISPTYSTKYARNIIELQQQASATTIKTHQQLAASISKHQHGDNQHMHLTSSCGSATKLPNACWKGEKSGNAKSQIISTTWERQLTPQFQPCCVISDTNSANGFPFSDLDPLGWCWVRCFVLGVIFGLICSECFLSGFLFLISQCFEWYEIMFLCFLLFLFQLFWKRPLIFNLSKEIWPLAQESQPLVYHDGGAAVATGVSTSNSNLNYLNDAKIASDKEPSCATWLNLQIKRNSQVNHTGQVRNCISAVDFFCTYRLYKFIQYGFVTKKCPLRIEWDEQINLAGIDPTKTLGRKHTY